MAWNKSVFLTLNLFLAGSGIREGRFGSKVGQIGPKWDKSGTFSDQISVHLAPMGPIWLTLEPNLPSLDVRSHQLLIQSLAGMPGAGVLDLTSYWASLAPNLTIFFLSRQNVLKSNLKKVLNLFPNVANLTHFGAKPNFPCIFVSGQNLHNQTNTW